MEKIETHVRGHVMQLNLTVGPFDLCRPICGYSGLLNIHITYFDIIAKFFNN